MIENNGTKEMGPHANGYTHFSGKPVDPTYHEAFYVAQSLFDGWELYCSCGQFRAFGDFFEFPTPPQLGAALRAAFDRHVAHVALGAGAQQNDER